MASKIVSILGCGWLGLPLAQSLVRQRFKVKGSTTTPAKVPLLKQSGIEPYLLSCDPQIKCDDIEEFFDADIFFLNIPFKRDLPNPEFYKEQIEAVLLNLQISPVKSLIFASSTSVYADTNGLVKEEDELTPYDARSKVLLEIEERLAWELQYEATLVRFGGMYSEDRPPGGSAGAVVSRHGDSRVNLIHRDDAVQVLSEIINVDSRGEVFNACADEHPTLRELYTAWAGKRGTPAPTFSDSGPPRYKIVANDKFKRRFSFSYKHPNPLLG
jgi:nucleoside-diphosphate-sugar epimerase